MGSKKGKIEGLEDRGNGIGSTYMEILSFALYTAQWQSQLNLEKIPIRN